MRGVFATTSLVGVRVVAFLDWILSVVERLLALALSSAALILGYRFVTGTASQAERDLIVKIGDNWKTVLILLIPLFYRTVRTFLEEVHEAFGMKRRLRGESLEPEETKQPRLRET